MRPWVWYYKWLLHHIPTMVVRSELPFHCHNFSDKDINFEDNISTHRFKPTCVEFATSCGLISVILWEQEADATVIWININVNCIHWAISNWRQSHCFCFFWLETENHIKVKKKHRTLHVMFLNDRIENMTYNDHSTFDGISWRILGHYYVIKHFVCVFIMFSAINNTPWLIIHDYILLGM